MESLMTRRELLKSLGLLMGGLAVGCTPVRIALHSYPDAFDHDPELVERTLSAFVHTVIPGIMGRPEDLARVYGDAYYPFAPYRGYFAADLCRRARERFGRPRFDLLSPAERNRVVRDGLGADGITKRLYGGAIFLAQIACFPGIYDDARGCPLIGFEGASTGHDTDELSYPTPERYLPAALTADGNPS
jgi:hypothetical protein